MLHRNGVLVLAIAAATIAAGQPVTPIDRAAGIEAFEKVWTTVRDKHWDPKLGGLDWQAVHDELRPKVEAAKSADAVREILNDMVGRLKQTHFGVFPAEVYHDIKNDSNKPCAIQTLLSKPPPNRPHYQDQRLLDLQAATHTG